MRRLVTISLAALALATTGVQFSAAAFSTGSANPANTLVAKSDWLPPTVTASQIVKTAGGVAGVIKQGGAYRVYASVADTGNPASGTASVKANVSSITSNQTAATLTSGSYPIGDATYNYRSGSLTAKSSLAAGSMPYTLTVADAAANSATETGFSVEVDNSSPAATGVQTTNAAGGTAGKAELGDELALAFSEPIDPNSIVAAWSGTAANVVVRIANGSGSSNDVLTIRNAANSTQLPLGSVNLGRADYVTTTVNFGATATASQMRQDGNTIALTLGTPSAATTTAGAAAEMTWTPAAGATDAGGNAALTTAIAETGTADLDF